MCLATAYLVKPEVLSCFTTCTLAATCCVGHPACIALFPALLLSTPPGFGCLRYAKYCRRSKAGGVEGLGARAMHAVITG